MSLVNFREHALKISERHTSPSDKEREFWRSMGRQQAPLYGADLEGSLFDSSVSSSGLGLQEWNFDAGLNDLLRMLPYKVPGVNTPMLYVGEWRAMFPFHVEDLDLYSINYLHTGAAKSWYSVAPSCRERFENLAESHFADDLHQCKEYMRHKTKIFSPTKLRDCGMKFETVVQQAGEFVVTFPGAYHGGFNHDFNIAEATNFATPRWLELGRKATRCVCRPHSVYINIDELETLYRRNCLQAKAVQKEGKHKKLIGKPPAASRTTTSKCNVVDLTVDSSTSSAGQMNKLSEHSLLRCECGEVRPVQLHERAELLACNSLTPYPNHLLRCDTCLFYVHRHCARPTTDSAFKCYMCRRIDNYVAADTLTAVTVPSEPSGQRTSSLKALQFGSSASQGITLSGKPNPSPPRQNEEEVLYFIDRTPSPELMLPHHQWDFQHVKTHRDKTHHSKRKSHTHTHHKKKQHRHSRDKPERSAKHKSNRNSHKYSNSRANSQTCTSEAPAKKRHAEIQKHRKKSHSCSSSKHCTISVAAAAETNEQNEEEIESEPDLGIDLQMRDTVIVVAPGRLQHTVGIITGIEGDLCRLHVKGQRKREDQWIPLRDCTLYLN
eukprot:gene10296-12047_t